MSTDYPVGRAPLLTRRSVTMAPMGREDWSLVGRDDLVATVIRHLADPACDGVLLVGAAGVGTTRLLDEVHARLTGQRRLVNRVVGSQALHAVPYGALSHAIPGDLRSGDGPLDPLELFERLRAVIGLPRTAAHRFVTCVDDVRWLDDASTGLLSQLIAAKLATVVATVHDDDVLPEGLGTLERSFGIRRVVVPPLSRDQTLAVIDQALAGPVDGTTALALAGACRGVPLYLAEILDGSIATGALTTVLGTWTMRGVPTVTPRLGRLFDQQVGRLDQRGRDLLELIAFAEPVALDALDSAGLVHQAVDLEDAGLLRVDAGEADLVRVTLPLLATYVRTRTSPLRRRALLPRAIDLVAAHPAADDVVRLALWRLECGREVTVAELDAAAARARAANDFEATEELATAAVQREPTITTLLLQAEALHDLCRFEAADEAMQRAEALVADDLAVIRLHIVRHRLLLWGRHDGRGSEATLRAAIARLHEPLLKDLARSAIANTMVFSGRPGGVREVRAELETGHPLVHAAMLFPEAIAAVYQGRVEHAVALAREGVATRTAFPADAPIGHPALSGLALAVVLIEAGSFEEADAVLAATYTEAVEQRIPQLHTWLALSRGRCALFQGRVGDARRWFTEARSVAEHSRFSMGERIALTGLLVCAGHVRDAETARLVERALTALAEDHGLLWPERMLGLAWGAVAAGRPDAVAMLLAGADEALLRGERLLEVELLYEAARVGDPSLVAARMADAMAGVDGPLLTARALWVRAAAAKDAAGLAQAEKRFANLGAWVAAAEAAADLARVHHAAGRTRDAQGAANRSAQYLAGLTTVITPRLGRAPSPADLTPREHEIARLAAAGHASKQIAQRLGLSVRTVSNHLQNAYLKLGISGREDLADALGGAGPGGADA